MIKIACTDRMVPGETVTEKAALQYYKEVHLGDNNRRLPGHGSLDWKVIIRALKDIEYDGFIALECGIPGDSEKLLPECAAYLKNLIETV